MMPDDVQEFAAGLGWVTCPHYYEALHASCLLAGRPPVATGRHRLPQNDIEAQGELVRCPSLYMLLVG